MNKITIIGNLGRDPEMRYTPDGEPMTHFSVASNRRYRTRDGEMQEETHWFNCTAFNKLANVCNDYLRKGGQVYLEGRLNPRLYDRQDGSPAISMDVNVFEMQMLGGPRERDESPEYMVA